MNQGSADFAAAMKSHITRGRDGQPDEIAAVAAILTGPSAFYITGVSLDVDGGFSV